MASREYWVFDGEVLTTPYSDVKSRSAGWRIPSRDGDNMPNPNSDGEAWQPYKPFTRGLVTLDMWVTGRPDDDNPFASPKELLKSRLDRLVRLFGRSSNLFRLERRNYMDGAVNRVTNPKLSPHALVTRSTGVTKLSSANYTAPANGYVGFELPKGSSINLNVNGVAYNYLELAHGIAGWVYLESGKSVSGVLPPGANAYFYNPTAANHVQVANVFPLPRAVAQWQILNWNGSKIVALTADGSGKLVFVTPTGGKYTYTPNGEVITPAEQVKDYYISETLAPVYLAELDFRFPADLKFDTIPTKLFPGVAFADTTASTIRVPSGNLTFVPTDSGYVLPAKGTTMTYNTSGWKYVGSDEWETSLYSSGVLNYRGVKPTTEVKPLNTGTTIYSGSAWHDAHFGSTGQSVDVTFKNHRSFIVSPTVVKQVGVYTHAQPLGFPPEFYDGSTFNATWVSTPNNSETLIHSSRWIDVEGPKEGVDFASMAGGTRAEFALHLNAPGVYYRDNVEVVQAVTWSQSAAQSGQDFGWDLTQFAGGTGPVGGVVLEITSTCTQTGFDVQLEVFDVETRRTVVLTMPVNQTWRLDAEQFLFYQTAPQLSIDRYASFSRVQRSFGGELITVYPTRTGVPKLIFRTQQFPTQTIYFNIKLTGHRRYLIA